MKTVWLSWHRSSRSVGLAAAMNIPLVAWQLEGPAILRHSVSALWTAFRLVMDRPRIIFLQHSFVLALMVACWKRCAPWRVVVVDDCHTKALRRRMGGPLGPLFQRLRTWSISSFDLVTLATPSLVDEARDLGCPIRVIPDPLHDWPDTCETEGLRTRLALSDEAPVVTAVCSFAEDEPVDALLEGVKQVHEAQICITGRPPPGVSDTPLPENARLTGFLPPAEYRALLVTSDCVVVLTRDEGCFLSGAGEALSLAKPLVTSDTSSLRRDFGEAAVYVQPEARSIAYGIQSALERREELVDNALRLRQTRRESQLETLRDLQEHVRGLQRGGG